MPSNISSIDCKCQFVMQYVRLVVQLPVSLVHFKIWTFGNALDHWHHCVLNCFDHFFKFCILNNAFVCLFAFFVEQYCLVIVLSIAFFFFCMSVTWSHLHLFCFSDRSSNECSLNIRYSFRILLSYRKVSFWGRGWDRAKRRSRLCSRLHFCCRFRWGNVVRVQLWKASH